jgi:hypothetical protein
MVCVVVHTRHSRQELLLVLDVVLKCSCGNGNIGSADSCT